MATLVLDSTVEDTLLEQRRRCGGDRYDEVWDGVYVMAPLATPEHQRMVGRFSFILETAIAVPGLGVVYAGANVTDREQEWTSNYRCPDVVVMLGEAGGGCRDIGAALLGEPDFLIEIQSPGDATMDKLDFYGSIGVRELLVVDRDSKAVELFRLQRGALRSVGKSPSVVASRVVPLQFRRMRGRKLQVIHLRDDVRWVV